MARQLLIPAALRRGDLIGVVSPGSPARDWTRVNRAVRYLEGLGYRVVLGKHVTQTRGYLAGTDEQRADDLHAMFGNPRVKAIFCVRGGYGATRLLARMDYGLVARHPKIFVGFSDITALQLALWGKCRLVTFHGPMLEPDMGGGMDPAVEDWFWRMLTAKNHPGPYREAGAIPLHPGRATGRLLGGNLSLIASLLGTPFQPDFRRALVFIEEIAEEPYRVDRMMTQLTHSAVLTRASAILTGHFNRCVAKEAEPPTRRIEDVLAEFATRWGKPFLSRLPFGHVKRKWTVPIGVRAAVDIEAKTIKLLEAPVG